MERSEVQELCKKLRDGMKGAGTDEKALTDVLTSTSNEQRQEISREYKIMYGKDLISEIKSDTSGNYRKVCVGLLRTPIQYDAKCLMKTMKGLGTDEDTMIEIICTCSNEEMQELKEAYLKEYGKSLEDAVKDDTSGDFRRMMVSLIQAGRSMDKADPASAAADAQALYDAGEGRWGTDESVFNAILVTRSFSQLRAILIEYEKLANRPLMEEIDSELSGDFKKAIKTIIRVLQDKTLYYTERLHKSMKRKNTHDLSGSSRDS
ncbi:annexin A13-like [Glandiceps talaboti]